MLEAIKTLLDSNVINEDTHQAIQEAWETKLTEAREELRAELREEFAQRYEHDKKVMVEALDKMVTDGIKAEIEEFVEEKKAMAEDRVKFQKKMHENASKFNNFLTAKLAEEIKELRKDRQSQQENMLKLESFVAKRLAKEINEFAQDKRDVVETKVRLVAEAAQQLDSLKKRFVASSKKKVQEHVNSKLKAELTALNEDIKIARENNFGRRIYEAFASEFSATLLNENAEIRKLRSAIANKEKELKESKEAAKKLKVLAENKDREIRVIKENNTRTELMSDLLSTLNEEKAGIMRNLLESVQTSRLQNAFEKYLPAVLANKKPEVKREKAALTEGRKEVTGNKTAKPTVDVDSEKDNIIDLKKLAGL
jgi:hypothetical protein